MESKKKFYITIGILIAVFIIGISIIFYISKNSKKTVNENTNQQTENTNQTETNNANTNSQTNINIDTSSIDTEDSDNTQISTEGSDEEKDRKYINKLAKNFTERFGTFSNHGDFSNIENLKSYMTPAMVKWADEYIDRNKNISKAYYQSFTTDATKVNLDEYSFDNNQAKAMIETIRKEIRDNPKTERTWQQKLELQFKKENNVWKVNAAYWRN